MTEKQVDRLAVRRYATREEMGKAAAADFKAALRKLLNEKEFARVVFAAAPSQDEFLEAVAADAEIPFERVDAFHMDEYIGLPEDAPQGFGNFLNRGIFSRRTFRSVSYINGQNADPQAECARYAALLGAGEVDIVCMGIGENGHIAFNDPPVADFADPLDVKVVKLDDVCRMQQVHDGCFAKMADVPEYALTLTVPRLLRAKYHFCVVPGSMKANAVMHMLRDEISVSCPASALRTCENAVLYLDKDSGARW